MVGEKRMNGDNEKRRVVYLLGAGATQACVESVGSVRGILMRDLNPKLENKIRLLVTDPETKYDVLFDLVNSIVDGSTNYEHVITFLDNSPSDIHRRFADDLRKIFEEVLREQLDRTEEELGNDRFSLYSALLDMYQITGMPEELGGILTINYDEFIDDAAAAILGDSIDYGVQVIGAGSAAVSLKLLKLHGSFGWQDSWPISKYSGSSTLWIPPGIQKSKERYPFNILWGLARELLDCDVLRIVGCRLSSSDWDLISLLFTTQHANKSKNPYVVELIDSPIHAFKLQEEYPYLNIKSILEIDEMQIGHNIVSDLIGGQPRPYYSLSSHEQSAVREKAGRNWNWFRMWLKQMAEALFAEPAIATLETSAGEFNKLLNA